MKASWCVWTALFWPLAVSGQECKKVSLRNPVIRLSERTIVPGSVKLAGIPDSLYRIDHFWGDGLIRLTAQSPPDSATVCFSVLPVQYHRPYAHRDIRSYDSIPFSTRSSKVPVAFTRASMFPESGFQKEGSLTRGLAFGNRQNLAPVSALNFQMEGQLSPGLRLRATITDQQVPYQPEGNTQNLQGLDNVYIELSGKDFSVLGGDVVERNSVSASGFLRFSRNIQGLSLNIHNEKSTTHAAVGQVKGKFTSTVLEVDDGVLGPYRIAAPGETIITILANSERVFLDGRLLERGFNNDYVIDYNLGEIAFTNRVLITLYSRVRLDYDYLNVQFPRTLMTMGHQRRGKRGMVGVEYFREADSPGRTANSGGLSPDQLSEGVWSVEHSSYLLPGGDSIGYRPGAVLYKKCAFYIDGREMPGWKHTTNPDSAHFSVKFLFVGQGKGNYVLQTSTAFGNVYAWVEPGSLGPLGSFEPVILVRPPSSKELLAINGKINLSKYESIGSQVALSSTKADRLAQKDNQVGEAYELSVQSTGRNIPGTATSIDMGAQTERTGRLFTAVDRYRAVEFDRDWSFPVNLYAVPAGETVSRGHVTIADTTGNAFGYKVAFRKRGEYEGVQHTGSADLRKGKIYVRSDFFLLQARAPGQTSSWKRFSATSFRKGNVLTPGYTFRTDQNEVWDSDGGLTTAGYFNEHHAFMNIDAASHGGLVKLSHIDRTDYFPNGSEMQPYTRASTTQAIAGRQGKAHQWSASFMVRNLNYLKASESNEHSIAGKVDWRGSLLRNTLRTDFSYSAGNGRELKKDYGFVTVPTGQGTHTWRDDNANSIAELEEFYEAINPDERSYIRILMPTREFVPAYSSLMVFRLSADAPREWRNGTGILRFLSTLSVVTNLNRDIRTTSSEMDDRLLGTSSRDQLIGGRSTFKSTMFFNRASPRYGAEASLFDNLSQRVTSLGWELTGQKGVSGMARVNLGSQTMLKVVADQGRRNSESDYLHGRNFSYVYFGLRPEFSWSLTTRFRLTGYCAIRNKGEEPEPSELQASRSRQQDYGVEARWMHGGGASLQAEIRRTDIYFQGVENSAMGYDMLSALRPGQNMVWVMNFSQQLTNGLQIQLSYDGRKSPGTEALHIGRVQVSATF